jgi:hypothetical protein
VEVEGGGFEFEIFVELRRGVVLVGVERRRVRGVVSLTSEEWRWWMVDGYGELRILRLSVDASSFVEYTLQHAKEKYSDWERAKDVKTSYGGHIPLYCCFQSSPLVFLAVSVPR